MVNKFLYEMSDAKKRGEGRSRIYGRGEPTELTLDKGMG